MASLSIEHALPLPTSINEENLDLIGKIPIKKYEAILRILGNNESNITHNYALEETIQLMENLAGCSKKDIEKGIEYFVPKAAVHISNLKWQYYEDSTARLELILRAMSSVLHILSDFVEKIGADTRSSLYKSISKFWTIYRNSRCINANIVFYLREVRNCLRLIKDDQSIRPNIAISVESFINVLQSEYVAAFVSFIQILEFEYATGEWYYDWRNIRKKYFRLRKKSSRKNFEVRVGSFYKELIELSNEEFKKIERKNTKYRNLEYKVLKYGGAMINRSLPDHIDTLLLGYLHLIHRLLEEFFPQMKVHDQEIISFCNKIIQANIKKQLTFKAIEILYFIYVIEGNIKTEYFKSFVTYSLSQPPQIKPNNILIVSPSSFQYNLPLESATSDFTSFSSPQSPDFPPISPIVENQNRQSRISRIPSVRKFTTHIQKVQSFSVTRIIDIEKIIDNIIKLFDDRRKTKKNICEIESEFRKLLNHETNKPFDEELLSKLSKILEEKASHEPSAPSPSKEESIKVSVSIFSPLINKIKKFKNKKSEKDGRITRNIRADDIRTDDTSTNGKGSDGNSICSSVNEREKIEYVETGSIEESENDNINSIVGKKEESEKVEENIEESGINSAINIVEENVNNNINNAVGNEEESKEIEENVDDYTEASEKANKVNVDESKNNKLLTIEEKNEKIAEQSAINNINSSVSNEKKSKEVEENVDDDVEESEKVDKENVDESNNNNLLTIEEKTEKIEEQSVNNNINSPVGNEEESKEVEDVEASEEADKENVDKSNNPSIEEKTEKTEEQSVNNNINSSVGNEEENKEVEENVDDDTEAGENADKEDVNESKNNNLLTIEEKNEKIEEHSVNNNINSYVGNEEESKAVEENVDNDVEESEESDKENVDKNINLLSIEEKNEKTEEQSVNNNINDAVGNEEESKEIEENVDYDVEESEKVNVDESKNNNMISFLSTEEKTEKIEEQSVEENGNNNVHILVTKEEEEKGKETEKENVKESGNNSIPIIITKEERENEEVEKENEIIQEKNHLTIYNYTTINRIIQQPQQPEQPEQLELESSFFRVVKKVLKEVEIIIDKAAKAHQEAVSKSNNNSSLSINKVGIDSSLSVNKIGNNSSLSVNEIVEKR